MVSSTPNNSIFDDVFESLKSVYSLLKVQLASEEACANNAAGTWEDIADFPNDIVQRVMMRILKAIAFAIRTLVIAATPDFSMLPLGAGILSSFPVIAKFYGEASRTGAKMLEMYNTKIKSMESRNQAKFISGEKLLGKINRMKALANSINFIGDLLGIQEEVGIDEEALVEQVKDVAAKYATQDVFNTMAIDINALTSEEVSIIMGTVSYSESIMAKAESAASESFNGTRSRPYGYTGTSSITFFSPEGIPLTPSGMVNVDRTKLPGYSPDPEKESMWEDIISLHENMTFTPQEGTQPKFPSASSQKFWTEHGYNNIEEVVADFGEDARSGDPKISRLSPTGGSQSDTNRSIEDLPDLDSSLGEGIGDIGQRETDDPYMDDPERGFGAIIDRLMENLGDFIGDIVDAIDSEGASEDLADELEEARNQAKETKKNNKVIRIIESLKS